MHPEAEDNYVQFLSINPDTASKDHQRDSPITMASSK
jgi:hypothetical protein